MDAATWVHKKADDWLNEPGYQFHVLPSCSSCLPTHVRQIKMASILSTSHCIVKVSSSTRHTSGNTAEVTPMAQPGHSTFVGCLSNQAKSAKSWRYTWSYWASRSVSNLSEACSSKYEWWRMLKETQEWIVRGCYLSKGLKAADHARSSSRPVQGSNSQILLTAALCRNHCLTQATLWTKGLSTLCFVKSAHIPQVC